MNFCTRCNLATQSYTCPKCGAQNLRQAQEGDFCFVAELDLLYAKMLQNTLQQQSVPCVLQPMGSTAIALYSISAQKARIYVPYEYYDIAMELKDTYYSID